MFLLIELLLAAVVSGVALAFPRLGNSCFAKLERQWAWLARRRGLAVIVVGVMALLIRAVLLPLLPIPATEHSCKHPSEERYWWEPSLQHPTDSSTHQAHAQPNAPKRMAA
jgi:hypothetical protein